MGGTNFGINVSSTIRGKGGRNKDVAATMGAIATKKLFDAPIRLLKEDHVNAIYQDLCRKCQAHVDGYVHLACGRGGQHLNSDIEVDELIKQINKDDLLDLLTVEKGSVAKVMIDNVSMATPDEIMYK